jgi:ADP-ribose pyrophosphatase YjhB (NUDIX family)
MSRGPGLEAVLAGLPLPVRVHRGAYRLAFALMTLWWFVRRPSARGACVAIHDGERILVVRVSYRSGYALPGGGIAPGETPREAALRELREEVGLRPPPGRLEVVAEIAGEEQWRQISTVLFDWRPESLPAPQIDGREIVWAGYKRFAELRGTAMTPCLHWLVNTAGAPAGPAGR